jgi:hypothetical protein
MRVDGFCVTADSINARLVGPHGDSTRASGYLRRSVGAT